MRLVRRAIPDSITTLGADIDPYSTYNAGTTYAAGDRVFYSDVDGVNVYGTMLNIYESAQASNTGNDIHDTAWWIFVSAANPLKMFDQISNSQTISSAGSIETTFTAVGTANTVALLNCIGQSATVTVTYGGSTLYTSTQSLLSGGDGVSDWYEYFFGDVGTRNDLLFTDLPNVSGQTITVEMTAATGSVAIGTLMVGFGYYLGATQYGLSLGIIDYSRKQANDFGFYEIVERTFSKRMNATVMLPNTRVDEICNLLPQYRATPAVWIGSDDFGSSFIYGFIKEWELVIRYVNDSVYTLQIEGLS